MTQPGELSYIQPEISDMGLGKLALVLNLGWWKRCITFIWSFRQIALKPALLCTLGEICATLSLYLSWSDLINMSVQGTAIQGNELLPILIKAIIVMIVFGGASLVLTCWGVGLWIITLTGFCRSYLTQSELTGSTSLSQHRENVNYFENKKIFLLIVWLVYSVIMLIPGVLFFGALIVLLVSIPGVIPYPAPLTPTVTITAGCVALVSTFIFTNHFLVAMPLSSVSNKAGRAVAIDSFMLALETLPAVTIFSVLFLILSLIYSLPEILLYAYNVIDPNPSDFNLQIGLRILGAIWHGLSSILIWPLGLALPSEILKPKQVAE